MNENINLTPPAAPETPATLASETVLPAAPTEVADTPPPANILTYLVRAIDRALSANPKRDGWAQTCYMLLDTSGGMQLVCSSGTFSKLRDFEAGHQRCIEVVNSHTQDAARDAWMQNTAQIQSAIGTGTLAQHEGWTRADYEEDFDSKVRAAHAEQARIYLEALPACQSICERFVAVANRKAEYLETNERERHESFGVPYAPSNLIKAFKAAIKVAESRTVERPGGNASPRALLPYLDW
jgi:hypothetical protein